MDIEIICPLYNAEKYIIDLDKNIKKQKNVKISKISYILTESEDNTENLLKQINANYFKLAKKEFTHSSARENVAMKSQSDILVFITQDIEIRNEDWLEKLVEPIISGEAVAAYSRQITKYNNIEKYTREANYPENSLLKSKEDIEKFGLKTFFFSDASSCIKTSIYKELNGYDGKRFMFNEDMYIAYKIIMAGYKIKYCANSIVWHSHNFTIKQVYKRYKDTGEFFKQNDYMDKYGTTGSGASLAKYVLKRIIQERNFKMLLRYPFDMGARFIGMKVGKM